MVTGPRELRRRQKEVADEAIEIAAALRVFMRSISGTSELAILEHLLDLAQREADRIAIRIRRKHAEGGL